MVLGKQIVGRAKAELLTRSTLADCVCAFWHFSNGRWLLNFWGQRKICGDPYVCIYRIWLKINSDNSSPNGFLYSKMEWMRYAISGCRIVETDCLSLYYWYILNICSLLLWSNGGSCIWMLLEISLSVIWYKKAFLFFFCKAINILEKFRVCFYFYLYVS